MSRLAVAVAGVVTAVALALPGAALAERASATGGSGHRDPLGGSQTSAQAPAQAPAPSPPPTALTGPRA